MLPASTCQTHDDRDGAEAAEVARGLSFDVTEDELTQAAAALRAERANQSEPEKLTPESLDTADVCAVCESFRAVRIYAL